MGLWIFGLLAMFALPAPVTITEDKLHRYGNKLREVLPCIWRCLIHDQGMFKWPAAGPSGVNPRAPYA